MPCVLPQLCAFLALFLLCARSSAPTFLQDFIQTLLFWKLPWFYPLLLLPPPLRQRGVVRALCSVLAPYYWVSFSVSCYWWSPWVETVLTCISPADAWLRHHSYPLRDSRVPASLTLGQSFFISNSSSWLVIVAGLIKHRLSSRHRSGHSTYIHSLSHHKTFTNP